MTKRRKRKIWGIVLIVFAFVVTLMLGLMGVGVVQAKYEEYWRLGIVYLSFIYIGIQFLVRDTKSNATKVLAWFAAYILTALCGEFILRMWYYGDYMMYRYDIKIINALIHWKSKRIDYMAFMYFQLLQITGTLLMLIHYIPSQKWRKWDMFWDSVHTFLCLLVRYKPDGKTYYEAPNNAPLYDLAEEWKHGKQYGAYYLVGESGSGKGAFLRHLEDNFAGDTDVAWYSEEDVTATICNAYRKRKQGTECKLVIRGDVIFIEHMDSLLGKDATQNAYLKIIADAKDEGKLIICTGTKDVFGENDVMELITYYPTPLTLSVVGREAGNYGVKLTLKEAFRLCKIGSFAKLQGELKKMRLLLHTKEKEKKKINFM